MSQPSSGRGTWVQTERAAHEAWANLCSKQPRAAALLHTLVANMDRRGALVISQSALAELMGCSVATLKRAISALKAGRWIQTIRIGSERGGALAYVVNSRVAWGDKRENLRFARFDAVVYASATEQTEDAIDGPELRQIPSLAPGEQQLPAGDGEPPPAQLSLEGEHGDLPAILEDEEGRRWVYDEKTGGYQGVID